MKKTTLLHANHRWLVIAIGLGVMLNPLNSSMISVTIPALQEAFRLDYTGVSWIISAFYISSAVAQPIMGKASDLFGRRRIFLSGLIVTFAASLTAPLSTHFVWLIALRIVQSIGTSMMVAVGIAVIRIQVTERQAAALATLSVFLSGAAAIGPFVGGLLTEHWGWQAIFVVNLPFALIGFLLASRVLPHDHVQMAAGAPSSSSLAFREWLGRIDLPGVLLFTGGLVTLFIGLLSFKSVGEWYVPAIALTVTGFVLLLLCGAHELRTAAPFIPLTLFARYPAIIRVNIEFMLANLLFYAVFFGLPSYLLQVRQIGEYHTGLLMLSLGLCSLAVSPLAGRWLEKSGPTPVLRASALIMLLGVIGMMTLNDGSSTLLIVLILASFGIGNGLNGVAMQVALFSSSPKQAVGVVSGLFNTFRYLGTIASSLLTGLVMGGNFNDEGFETLGISLTATALLLLALSLPRRKAAKEG